MFQEITVTEQEYVLQPAGRTSARIVEDIVRYHTGTRSFAFSPLTAAKGHATQPHFTAATVKSSHLVYHDSTPLGSRFYTLLYDSHTCCHLYVDLQHEAPLAPGEMHDFHFMDYKSSQPTAPKVEIYEYKCSVTASKLKLTFKGPEFTSEDLEMFHPSAIAARDREYREEFPEIYANSRKGKPDTLPTPAACFGTLFRIIDKPLNHPGSATIHMTNATLNLRVNPEILFKLHFTIDDEEQVWVPPDVYEPSSIEDFEKQESLIRKYHEIAFHLKSLDGGNVPFVFEKSLPTLVDMLSASNYPQSTMKRGASMSSAQYGAFVALGAVEDFADSLIVSRYEIQCQRDPSNTPYYFEALKSIAQQRGSEELEIKVMELMSVGVIAVSDLNAAYQKFSLSPENEVDEDLLIATYRQFIRDQPSSSQQLKDALKVISDHTRSQKIDNFLKTDSMSLDEAYMKLGIASTIDNDEIIHLAYETKRQECNSTEEVLVNNALLTIAKSRGSNILLSRYEEAVSDSTVPMTLEEAYILIGASRTTSPETLIAVYKLRVKDSPDDVLSLRCAMKEIAKDLGSKKIELFLTDKEGSDLELNMERPVGLENIGNTCYLNSLLQYYFTITPLRESVINFATEGAHGDLIDIGDTAKREKRVGGRVVTPAEVKRSQEFVKGLEELFQELIHTPKSAISPKKNLAYLALVPSWEDVANEETPADNKLPDAEPPVAQVKELTDNEAIEHNKEDTVMDTMDISETTSDSHSGVDEQDTPDSDAYMEDTEMTNETSGPNKRKSREFDVDFTPEREDLPSTGPVPPPLPSRPSELTDHTAAPTSEPKADIVEERSKKIDMTLFGRQQDVTECIENVLFQVEAAFKPTGFDDDGEQLDIVKQLFYGKTKQTLESEQDGSNHREKTERFSNLLVDVAEGPRDLYDALDSYFGENVMKLEDGETRRTVTIAELPPVLQIQIQRVQFDRVANQPFKSNALLRFDETIYMDRYLDSDDPELKRKRREVADWRMEVAKLKKTLKGLNSKVVSFITLVPFEFLLTI